MNLTAVMMFFDEVERELRAGVAALAGFADRLVAVDGRWDGFPSAWVCRSPHDQIDVVVREARRAGLALTLHQPNEPWRGECHHRNSALSLALSLRPDWIFLMDADERVRHAGAARRQLEETGANVGTVRFHTRSGRHPTFTQWETPGEVTEQRRLFRADPSLRYQTHHWWLRSDREALWGEMPGLKLAPATALDMAVEHRTCMRPAKRWRAKADFIAVRDPADAARGYEH